MRSGNPDPWKARQVLAAKRKMGIAGNKRVTLVPVEREVTRVVIPEEWKEIGEPGPYLAARVGRWIQRLELLLDVAVEKGDMGMARALCKDLIQLTKLGTTKAEVTIGPVNKLREETDFSRMGTEELMKLLEGKGE